MEKKPRVLLVWFRCGKYERLDSIHDHYDSASERVAELEKRIRTKAFQDAIKMVMGANNSPKAAYAAIEIFPVTDR